MRKAPLNSALLLSPAREPVARYDKIHLVPFGEYVPWPFGFANKITSEVATSSPGTRIVTAQGGNTQDRIVHLLRIGLPCPDRKFVQNGAEALFNLSNDGYFGRSESAREQHLLVVRMRPPRTPAGSSLRLTTV
jgi:apolipoprotein N-acyltransferase